MSQLPAAVNIGDGHMFPHTRWWWVWWPRGQCQGWVWVWSVMMSPDSRLSCKNIYDPGSHTEMRAAQKIFILENWWIIIAVLSSNWAVLLSCLVFGQIEKTSKSFLMQMKVYFYLSCLCLCFIWELLCTFLWWPRLCSQPSQQPIRGQYPESVANQRPERATRGITCLNELSSHLEFISPPWEHSPHVQWGENS